MPEKQYIMIIEDDEGLRELIIKILNRAGYEVSGFASGTAALEQIAINAPSVLLLDQNLPDMTGSQVLDTLSARGIELPFIVMTGQGDERLAVEMMKKGASDYLIKDTELLDILPVAMERLFNSLRMEQALQESEEKHQRLFDTMIQGVIYLAADGAIISANPAAERILGLSFEEMQGKTSIDSRWKMIKEDGTSVAGEDHPVMIALRTGKIFGPVTRGVFRPDKNAHVWLNITAIPLFLLGETEPYQAYATLEDITERKQAEEALRHREEEFRALAENAPDIVARFDRELRHVYINPAIEKITGIPRDKFIGHTNEELNMPIEQIKLWNSNLQSVFKEGQEREMFFEYITPRGRKYYHSRITPEFASDGTVGTVLSVNRDITEIKNMEAALYQERLRTVQMHQRSLPDELPSVPGISLGSFYRSATVTQGNYYNAIRHGDQLLIYLVDTRVAREDGIMQSLYVRKTIKEYLTIHADDTLITPADLLRYLTNHYQEGNIEERIPLCVFIAVIEMSHAPKTNENRLTESQETSNLGKLSYVSTGFCTSPIHINSSNPSVELSLENLCLPSEGGGESHSDFCEHSISINPGSIFIFYTDGLINQSSYSSTYEPHLKEILGQNAHLPPELIKQAIERGLDEFYSDSSLNDDIAFIIAQVPKREERVNFKVESDFQQVPAVDEKVALLLMNHLGYKPDIFVFHELLVNAIEHGNKRDGGKKVTVDIIITDRYYKFTITDQGDGFNWRERINKELDLEGESERGRGIIMTNMMAEYLGYNERGNTVILINLIE